MNKLKRGLLALGLAGITAFGVNADQLKLSDEFIRGDPIEIVDSYNNGNSIKLTAQSHNHEWPDPESGAVRDLTIVVKDPQTCVFILDRDADGLNEKDDLTLSHDFQNGDNLFLRIQYNSGDFQIDSRLNYNDGSSISGEVNTKDLIKPVRYLAKRKIKPVIEWGDKMYHNLIESVNNGTKPQLPYEKVKQAIEKAHSDVDRLKDSGLTSIDEMVKIADTYIELTKENN